jgi:predicted  nucleic acid-binding Zn-ribbon protein
VAAGGGPASKELETLKVENVMLKERNAKLEYRIKHILSEMEAMYEEQKKIKGSHLLEL